MAEPENETLFDTQIESADDKRKSRRDSKRGKKRRESSSDAVTQQQPSSSDHLSSEQLQDEPAQKEGRTEEPLQRRNSRSRRSSRRLPTNEAPNEERAAEEHQEEHKRRHKRHSKSRRSHKSNRALTQENIMDGSAPTTSLENHSSDDSYDIMSDIRNFQVWDDEEIPTKSVGKKRKDKKKKQQEARNENNDPQGRRCPQKKWVWIGVFGLAIAIGGGLAYLFLVHPPSHNSPAPDVQISEKTAAPVTADRTLTPTATPNIILLPSARPTQFLLYHAPSEEDCIAIQNRQMIPGQEELPVETLYIDMDVTLSPASSRLDISIVTALLANKINTVLVPEITGCLDDSTFRRDLQEDDAMKYIIANAAVEAFQSANGVCTSSGTLPCFKVAVVFDLAVRAENVKYLTLCRRISSAFGNNGQSLLKKLRLEDRFQEIVLENLYLEDRSISPTIAPSHIPTTLPPSIPPSRTPTIHPSKNPTQSPSNLATHSPTRPPSPPPTPFPTTRGTPQPTRNPTPRPTERVVQTSTLTYPREIVSSNGVLSTSLNIAERSFTIPNSNIRINGRLLGGQFPGPTLRLKAGDSLQINFSNDLDNQGLTYVHNRYSGVDDSNLHFHGLYVSGELPSDDVTYAVPPGSSYAYSTTLPSNHMGGTFWMHPHRHGATAIQVGGGANCVIIVEDEPGTLPSEVENAREVVFIAQYFEVDELQRVARISGDRVFSISGHSSNRFVTVNGQLNPTIEVDAGEWFRLRIVWVNFLQGDLDLQIDNCDLQLLAKDGVYIRDYPRRIFRAEVPSGGRADIMVRCPQPSTTYEIDGIVGGFAMIRTSSAHVNSASLQAWRPTYPGYLSDLRSTNPSSGCTCRTSLRGTFVNDRSYPSFESYMHQSYIGAVVQRNIEAVQHPYHQHVYPFQLVSGDSNTYYAIGDWHDVMKGRFDVRYSPSRYTGKLMIHCHRLVHEDRGMMAMEKILDSGSCSCDYS